MKPDYKTKRNFVPAASGFYLFLHFVTNSCKHKGDALGFFKQA